MKKTFRLPLLAALPAVLAACMDAPAQQTYQDPAPRLCEWHEDDDVDDCYEEDDDKRSFYKGSSSSVTKSNPGFARSKPSRVTRGGLTSTSRASGSSYGG